MAWNLRRKGEVDTHFNGKTHKAKKSKRPNRWFRVANEDEFEFIRKTHHQGVLLRTIAEIFTLDEPIIQMIVLAGNYSDYKTKITKVIGGSDDSAN